MSYYTPLSSAPIKTVQFQNRQCDIMSGFEAELSLTNTRLFKPLMRNRVKSMSTANKEKSRLHLSVQDAGHFKSACCYSWLFFSGR